MRNWVRTYFSLPNFPDEEQRHKALIVLRVLGLTFGGAIIFGITAALLGWSATIPLVSGVTAFLVLICVWLLQRGKILLPSLLVPSALLFLVTFQIIQNHGAHDEAILIYPCIISFAWLLLNRRTALTFLSLSLLSIMLVIALEVNGVITPQVDGSSEYLDIITFVVTLGTVAFVSDSVVDDLRATIKRLKNSEHNLLQRTNELAQREAEIRMFIEEAPVGIAIMDSTRRIQLVNSRACEMIGFTEQELIGRDGAELISQEELARLPLATVEILADGRPTREERILTRKDGSMLWVLASYKTLPDGRLQYSVQDITDRKKIEQSLRESEEHYRGAIIAAGLVPYEIDYRENNRRFTFIGEDISKLTGYSSEEFTPYILKASVQEDYIWGPNAKLTPAEARREFLAGNIREWRSDMRILTRTGESRWLSDTSIEIADESGKAQGAIGIFQDITERKRIEAERENLITELEKRNAELERFNYTLSHELKTPLVTIRGFLGFLEESVTNNNPARIQSDIRRIAQATDKMHDMINELLELSRIGRVLNSLEDVAFADVVREGLHTVESRIHTHNVTIKIDPDLPILHGDRPRLVEVIQNLVDNAIKYMGTQPEPAIRIGKRIEDNLQILFVQDNGIGIAPAYHERIFGLFDKLDPLSEGTGIGLALVKRIITVHGGRIWVESDGLGTGSTFCFTLPIKE